MVRCILELWLLHVRNARDVGVQLAIATDMGKSPYLETRAGTETWHYLEVYLHSIADTQGAGRGFELAVAWDVALVTKVYDALLASWMDCEEEENGE